jgi:hypothetical protein
MGVTGPVAGIALTFYIEERYHMVDVDKDGGIILKLILMK